MSEYKHLKLLEQLTEVARTNDKPWEEFQCTEMNGLSLIVKDPESMNDLSGWIEDFDFEWRRKPKTPTEQVDNAMTDLEDNWPDREFLNRIANLEHLETTEPMVPLSELKSLSRTLPANMWINPSEVDALISKYTPTTKTVTINGVEIEDDRYTEDDDLPEAIYVESPAGVNLYTVTWSQSERAKRAIERRIAHKTAEGAEAFTKARLGVD